MKTYQKLFLQVFVAGAALLSSAALATAYSTWSAPTASPPGNNADTPINAGSSNQVKTGSLTAGTLGAPSICIGVDCRSSWPSDAASQWTTTGANIYYNSGNVGVKLTSPSAPVDVNGGLRGSGSSVVLNASCSPEGMQGYDLTNHTPVYCSQSGKWTNAITGFPPNSQVSWSEPSIGMPCRFTTDSKGYPTATIYRNTSGGWVSQGTVPGLSIVTSNHMAGANNSYALANVWIYNTVCLLTPWGMSVTTFYNSVTGGSTSAYTSTVAWSSL